MKTSKSNDKHIPNIFFWKKYFIEIIMTQIFITSSKIAFYNKQPIHLFFMRLPSPKFDIKGNNEGYLILT